MRLPVPFIIATNAIRQNSAYRYFDLSVQFVAQNAVQQIVQQVYSSLIHQDVVGVHHLVVGTSPQKSKYTVYSVVWTVPK